MIRTVLVDGRSHHGVCLSTGPCRGGKRTRKQSTSGARTGSGRGRLDRRRSTLRGCQHTAWSAGQDQLRKASAPLRTRRGLLTGVRNGKFGARAARLLDYLDTRHYGVELPDEDFHRMVLWLDMQQ